jgi:hypothetical protein
VGAVSGELVDFLRARLDEDESTARAADGDAIEATPLHEGVAYLTLRGDHTDRYTGELPAPLADHVARHDPARVLADIEADRALIRDYVESEAALGVAPDMWDVGRVEGLRVALRTHAARYAKHEDYIEEWAP